MGGLSLKRLRKVKAKILKRLQNDQESRGLFIFGKWPHSWGKEYRMFKILTASAVVMVGVALIACGGGGSSDGGKQAVGIVKISPATCDVSSEGGTGCSATLTGMSANISEAQVEIRSSNGTVGISANADFSLPVAPLVGDTTYILTAGGVELARATITVKCAPGFEAQVPTGKCSAVFTHDYSQTLHYDRVTVLIENLYPHVIGDDGIPVPAKNETGYTFGDTPIWNAWYGVVKHENGYLFVLARVTSFNSEFRLFVHNPVTNVLSRYDDPLPVGLEWNANGPVGTNWKACMRYCTEPWGDGIPPFASPDAYSWAPARNGGYWFGLSLRPGELWYMGSDGQTKNVYTGRGATFMWTVSN